MGLHLDFIFDRANEDRIFDDGNDDPTGGKIYDNFFGGHILNLLRGGWARIKQEGDRHSEKRRDPRVRIRSRAMKPAVRRPGMEKQQHSLTVSQNYCYWG
jgi:hypothetical protein